MSISEDDFKAIKKVLDPNTPGALVNKVWFDVQLCKEMEGNRQPKPTSSTIKRDQNWLKYTTLALNEHIKNHKDPQGKNEESTYDEPDDPLPCFIYREICLPPTLGCTSLIPSLKKTSDLRCR